MIKRLLISTFLALFMANTVIAEEGIESLLKKLERSTQEETRKESLGFLTTYTRSDIEKMQAHRLVDLLKTVRFYTAETSNYGNDTLYVWNITAREELYTIKLYINDIEVSQPDTLSPIGIWFDMPLYFVDHVDIYQEGGAIQLGDEPGTIIIKVYTKRPEREEINAIAPTLSTDRGSSLTLFSAHRLNDRLSYLLSFNLTDDDRKEYSGISRDRNKYHFFLGLYHNRTALEVSTRYKKGAPFVGTSIDAHPDSGSIRAGFYSLSLKQDFLSDDSLRVILSINNYKKDYIEKNAEGIIYPPFVSSTTIPLPPYIIPLFPVSVRENLNYKQYAFQITKTFTSKSNRLFLGFKTKTSDFSDKKICYSYSATSASVTCLNNIIPFDRETLYAFSIEDQLSINNRNLLIGGIKYDTWDRNSGYRNIAGIMVRLGYITIPWDNLKFKTFLSRTYVYPPYYIVQMAGKDLDKGMLPYAITAQLNYQYKKHEFSLYYDYSKFEDIPFFDIKTMEFNNGLDLEGKALSFIYKYNFYNDNKAIFNYWKIYYSEESLAPEEGANISLLYSLGRFDTYTELLYRRGYKAFGYSVDDGYDLNISVTYNIDERRRLFIKVENLLNEGTEAVYPSIEKPPTFPGFERNIYLGLEWEF